MIHSTALLVLLAVVATARLSRLVTSDAILDAPRALIQQRGGSTLAYFVGCPWCVSVWLGLGVAGATYAWHRYWPVQVALVGLAGSLAAGVVHLVVERLELLGDEPLDDEGLEP